MSLKRSAQLFAPSTIIDVVVVDLSIDATQLLGALIDRNSSKADLCLSFKTVATQFNRYKKDLQLIEEILETLLSAKNNNAIVLFSRLTGSGYYKFIL